MALISEIPRHEAQERMEFLRTRQEERVQPKSVSSNESAMLERQEIIELAPAKVLVVCFAGVYRSGLIADVLRERGYEALNVGITSKDLPNIDVSEYDAVITMTEHTRSKFLESQKTKGDDNITPPLRIIAIPEEHRFHTDDKELATTMRGTVEKKLNDLGFMDKNTKE